MKVKVAGLERLKLRVAGIPKEVRAATKAALRKNAQELTAAQKSLVPAESGDLRHSIGYTFGPYKPANSNVRGVSSGAVGEIDPDLTVIVHAGDEKAYYAAMVEFGTAPHEIKPKKAPALRLKGNRYVERVDHPGSEPHPFFFPPYRMMRRRLKGRVTRAMRKAVKDAAK